MWTPTLSPHHSQAVPPAAAPQLACLPLMLYPWRRIGGERTKNGAQLLFPVRDTNLLTVCVKSLLHQWELCQRTTTTPRARSGKQGPSWAVSRGQCFRVERKEGGIQTFSAFGEDFLSPTSWVPLQGRGEKSINYT